MRTTFLELGEDDMPSKGQEFIAKRMHDFKAGRMHGGTGKPGVKLKKPVTKRKQAVAIALSEAREKGFAISPIESKMRSFKRK